MCTSELHAIRNSVSAFLFLVCLLSFFFQHRFLDIYLLLQDHMNNPFYVCFFFLSSIYFLGRIHSAMVSKINYDARSVTVEWYERNETKGKEIELDTILQLNAELAQQEELAASMPKIIKQTSSNALTRVSILFVSYFCFFFSYLIWFFFCPDFHHHCSKRNIH